MGEEGLGFSTTCSKAATSLKLQTVEKKAVVTLVTLHKVALISQYFCTPEGI